MPTQAHFTFQAGSAKTETWSKSCGFKKLGEEVYGRARHIEADTFVRNVPKHRLFSSSHLTKQALREKCPNMELFPVHIFLYSD